MTAKPPILPQLGAIAQRLLEAQHDMHMKKLSCQDLACPGRCPHYV